MKKARLGVVGAMRGAAAMSFCINTDMMELVAVCDCNKELLETVREKLGNDISYYEDFDSFIAL